MKNNIEDSQQVFFIGTRGYFSTSALNTLINHNVKISAVLLAGHAPAIPPNNALPVFTEAPTEDSHSISSLATKQNIPVYYLGNTKTEREWQQLLSTVEKHQRPDFIIVACFPQKLPDIVLSWPRRYSINLHPSLLPKYRGSDPVFWQLRNNESHTGISLHIMSNKLDAGPVLLQQNVQFPTNATRKELDTLLAQHGAQAFVQLLTNNQFIPVEQDEVQASYQPWPNNHELTDKYI